jgi:hypothetical protein
MSDFWRARDFLSGKGAISNEEGYLRKMWKGIGRFCQNVSD